MLRTLFGSSRRGPCKGYLAALVLYVALVVLFAQEFTTQSRVAAARPYVPPARHVIYHYQTTTDLSPLLDNLNPATGKPYVTDISVGSFHIGPQTDGSLIHFNDYRPDDSHFTNTWAQLSQLQQKGVKLHMVIGCSPNCDGEFAGLFNNWNTEYPVIKQTLTTYHFDGIEFDIEEHITLGQIQMLINRLSSDFGSSFQIILDPVGKDLTENPSQGLSGFDYNALYRSSAGSKITWFDTQFYNGWGNISSTSDYDKAITNGFPPSKVMASMLCNSADGAGYVDVNQVANTTVKSLVSEHSDFAGVSCWEYFNAEPGGEAHPEQWSKIMTQKMVLIPTRGVVFTETDTGTQSPTDFCRQATLPADVSQASCVSLVTNALNDPGESTLLQSNSFVSALQALLNDYQPTPFTANSSSSSGSVGPTLQKNCNPDVDVLTGTNPMTFTVGNVPYCDVVGWAFPDTANKTCQFQADGAFSANLKIDFYSNTSPNPDYFITSAFVSGNGTFSAVGTNIVHAYLNEGTVKSNSTNNLANIKYACQ